MEATPEDQHSQHAPEENINTYRLMRDHMHPPRMSAPSCLVPPTEQLVIRPHIVPLLPTFHGMESENPYAHIKDFEEVCQGLLEILRRCKKAIAWKIFDLKGISPLVCTHHIYMEEEAR
ncbi:hypothetical protein CK203_035657 [Vitis vinifera]|uniref:Reverse transcriptase domain-containing protein n=1 Tax=Vitis vinifera TaxID=29760 RepID=A0A438ICY7_VITVI|nr:hypothetical protein CK203_035657 [Vitis vinifera]